MVTYVQLLKAIKLGVKMVELKRLTFAFLVFGLTMVLAGPIQAGTLGWLAVEVGPEEAVRSGAAWSVDGGQIWRASGEEVALEPGPYIVHFKSLPGWREPRAYQHELASRTGLTLRITYVRLPQGRRLVVDLGPDEAVQMGASWSVDGGQTWQASGEAVDLRDGEQTVTFKPLPGWVEPPSRTVRLVEGRTAWLNCIYGPMSTGPVGWLSVTIDPPPALQDGAAWSVDAGTNWFHSGQRIRLEPGRYVVFFREIPGWEAPRRVETAVSRGGEATATGTYTRP